tara:strand:- start:9 stop:440 length:432 start_codon:yes stop_codon:yes gene_type:complete
MVLIKTDEHGHINIADVFPAKKGKRESAFIKFYTGSQWVLYRNDKYEEDICKEFPNEYYKSKSSVPIYKAYHNGSRESNLYARETENGFKFIVSIQEKINKRTLKKYNQMFYIASGFNKDYKIVKPTELTRKAKGNFSQYEGY